ncbi:MAG: rRNA maturation RNase YbeY [Lactobacillales bacterium]|jgi:probable rRNA maturation factor|nr:rRNA maturation RNase YbeY [Lactobacillales bacterium]
MLLLDIQIRDKRFFLKCLRLRAFCRKAIEAAWFQKTACEVSLVLADDSFIQELNNQYRGKDMPTNVLSFESGAPKIKGQPWPAGDIIIAYETVAREAKAQNKTFCAHFAHLLIHGALHLQGYDHITEKQAKKMESLETELMESLGYIDPYKDVL